MADMSQSSMAFFSLVKNPLKFRLFLLQKLPAAYFSGLRVTAIAAESATVVVPFKWFTRNPFRSTYFACLSMAAEMSTGILAMAQVYGAQPPVSMLIVSVEGRFHKKATSKTYFTCADGAGISEAIANAVASAGPQTIRAYSVGKNKAGEIVAEFWCTWSFKVK